MVERKGKLPSLLYVGPAACAGSAEGLHPSLEKEAPLF